MNNRAEKKRGEFLALVGHTPIMEYFLEVSCARDILPHK